MNKKTWRTVAAGLVLSLFSSVAAAGVFTIDIPGIASWDIAGDPDNSLVTINLAALLGHSTGTDLILDGVGWDLTIETVGASWMSEAVIGFGNIDDSDGIDLTPGIGADMSGTEFFSSGGLLILADIDPDLEVLLPGGLLVIEFSESFDDVDGEIDAFLYGTVDLSARVVPVPAAVWLFAGGLLTLFGYRRRA